MRKKSNVIKLAKAAGVALAGTAFILSASPTRADVVTFAQFTEASPTGSSANLFSYANNGPVPGDAEFGSNSNGTIGSSIPVTFSYETGLANLPADLQGPQAATLTLTSSTLSSAATSFGGTVADQAITGTGKLVDTLTITRDTPASEGGGSRTDLLSMTFTGNLMGVLGGTTPQLAGDTTLGDTVNYSSDFLAIDTTVNPRDFSMTFSSWVSLADGAGLELNSDGYYNASASAASGTFDASVTVGASVPEPGPLAMGAVLMLGILSAKRWRTLSE